MNEKKCLVQGYKGCYHEMAMQQVPSIAGHVAIPCDSFERLAKGLMDAESSTAIMAIENSIAGSILQNYRILRQYDLQIVGETYLKIRHQLMALPGQTLDDIIEVISHPMALNQCLPFLQEHPQMVRKEYSDTALAARDIAKNKTNGSAAIASSLAAEIYKLDILAADIESDVNNYTRFFILQKRTVELPIADTFNKSSIYMRLKHEPGSLLKVLECVHEFKLNLSKLQSFPVLGSVGEYYFFLDLEFDAYENYKEFMSAVGAHVIACEELGVYEQAKLKD